MSPGSPTPQPSGPDSQARMDAKALAAARREAMGRRARNIRRSVTGLGSTLFVVAFLAVYVQLTSGHDPSLLASQARRVASSSSNLVASQSTSSASSTEGSDDSGSQEGEPSSTESTGESSTGTGSSAGTSAEEPAPVVTSQS